MDTYNSGRKRFFKLESFWVLGKYLKIAHSRYCWAGSDNTLESVKVFIKI